MGISDRKRSIDVPVSINLDLNQEIQPNNFITDNNFKSGFFSSRKKSGNIIAGSKLNVEGQGIYNLKVIKPDLSKKFPKPTLVSEGNAPTQTPTQTPTPTPTNVGCLGIPYNLSDIFDVPTPGNVLFGDGNNSLVLNNPDEIINGGIFYFNAIDYYGNNQTSYFSNLVGNYFTLTLCQNNVSAVFSGTPNSMYTNSFGPPYDDVYYWDGNSNNLIEVISANTTFNFNELVYIDYTYISPTPTVTPTNTATPTKTPVTATPTPTPTITPSTFYGCSVVSNITTSGTTGYSTSFSLVYNSDNGYVYANNSNNVNDILTIINPLTSSVVGYIPMNSTTGAVFGSDSVFAVYNPNNKYLYTLLLQSVGIVNTLTNTQITTITASTQTRSILYNSNNDCVYVGLDTGSILVISGTSLVTTITGLPIAPWVMKFNPLGNTIYASYTDTLIVIDCNTNTLITSISLPGAIGLVYWMTFNGNYSKLYVPSDNANLLYVINTSTNIVTTTIVCAGGLDGVFVPTNNYIYIATYPGSTIQVINTLTDTFIQTLTGFSASRNVIYNPSNNYVYVTGNGLPYVKIIDASTNTNVTSLSIINPYNSLYVPSTNEIYYTNTGYNIVSVIRCTFAPTPTPTPTQTPTITPTQTFYYYEATGYECSQCYDVDIYIVKSLTPLTIGYFYNDPLNNAFSYQINQLIAESAVDSDLTGQPGYTDCIQSCYGIYEFRTATSCCNGVTVVMGGIPSSFGSQVLVGSDGGINAIGCYTIGSSPVSGPANILWSGDYGFDCASCINDWPCINALQHGTLVQACTDPGTIDDFCVNAPSFCSSTTIRTSNSVTCYGLAPAGYYGSFSFIRYWDGASWTTSCFSGCGCLVANTIITLSDGSTKLVQDIQINDELKSLDVEGIPQSSNDWYSWSSDTLNYVESTSIVVGFTSFEFDSVININDGRLIATGTHNHVVKQNGMWYIKTTLEIRVGDILLDIDNSEFEITSLVTINEPTTVYNIDVTNSNLYFANNVLTHNK